MSIPPHDPSTLNQDTPSINIKIASAADAGAPNSSALPSSFCVIKNNEHQGGSYSIRKLFYFRLSPNLSVPHYQSGIKIDKIDNVNIIYIYLKEVLY